MKLLFLDIETAPNTVHCWGLFKQTVSIKQIMESSYTMCWAAKWAGSKEVMFDSVHASDYNTMVEGIYALLEEADVVVTYNGLKFDIPTLNKEFLLLGYPPPSPYKQIDLLKTMRSNFRFPSNKLDYVAQRLGLGQKTSHEGHELWIKCMADDDKAWKTMEKYNKQDVVLLEKVYNAVLPWVKNHPNRNVYAEEIGCPKCGSGKLQRRGFARTITSVYQRYQCQDCGSWSQDTKQFKESTAIKETA